MMKGYMMVLLELFRYGVIMIPVNSACVLSFYSASVRRLFLYLS